MTRTKKRQTTTPTTVGSDGSSNGGKRTSTVEAEAKANDIIHFLPPLLYKNEEWYAYYKELGYYQRVLNNTIGNWVQDQLDDKVPARTIQGIIKKIGWKRDYIEELYLPIRKDGEDILHNVQDGVVRIKPDGTHSLEKHDAKWAFIGGLPVNYNSKKEDRTYFEQLKAQLPDEKDYEQILLFEAYCLIPDCRFNVALICH